VHMRIEVAVLPEEIRVRFIDDGRELEGNLHSVCLPDGMAERGRGLAVARAVLRHLSYQRTEDGNQWILLSERFSG
jgi:serine/threonine-protein kinase RsbW